MTTYNIEYDLTILNEFSDKFSDLIENGLEAALPNTAMAFSQAAKYIHNTWVGYLSGNQTLDGIDFMDGVTSAMVRSIRTRHIKDMNYEISSDNMQLERKIQGSKEVEYDMKKTHPYGKKSRVNKKGIPYLIIPFRWGTPNQKGTKRAHFNNFIPQKNYNLAVKGLNVSVVNSLKQYFEANYKGENVQRQGYDWAKNGRLTEDQAWDARSVGMVRMKDVTGSTYFTFRIISAKSPANSWIYHKDAKPAIDLMGALGRTVKPVVDSMISQGIKADEEMYRNM